MAAVCGIDWASEWHDVDIADEHGTRLLAARFAHDERGVVRADRGAERARRRAGRDRASRRAAGRRGCWPPGSRCWRSIPTRSPPRAIASAPPPASPTASTRSCCASSAAPTTTASPRSRPAATRRWRCARWSAPARTWSARASRWPTSCAPSSTPPGPAPTRIFADIDSPIALAFLARYPSPADARGLGPKRLDAFLARHAYCGRKTPEQLLERLRTRPDAAIGEHEERRPPQRRPGPRRRAAPDRRPDQPAHRPDPRRHPRHPDGPIFRRFFRDPKSVI